MINYTKGNLLEAEVEALVNTVNTVGVMGKGIALMFKERYTENNKLYNEACKNGKVKVGNMFVTETNELTGPKWIINFPTKQHWRQPTKIEWINSGLQDLIRIIKENKIKSIAIPPLGCGNGGLDWSEVKPLIESSLAEFDDLKIVVFEPTTKYQNVMKKAGVEKLTPARAIVTDLVRRYWVLGIECTLLEIQKLAWFAERVVHSSDVEDPLKLDFAANKFGPYADRLSHLLNSLDGSYLHCEKRIRDAGPLDIIWCDEKKLKDVDYYLNTGDGKRYKKVLEEVDSIIDGFQSPVGMEALATVDWLISKENVEPTVKSIKTALGTWNNDLNAGKRKLKIFSDRLLELVLSRIANQNMG